MEDVNSLIEQLHATPHKSVVAAAGGGSLGLAWLLGVPGASNTLLETIVPYGRQSMIGFLGSEPDQYVSGPTAQAMARAAYRRGRALREDDSPVVGVACTATLATNRPKRGDHRAFLATWDANQVLQYDLILEKGARDRAGEEEVCSRLMVRVMAEAYGVPSEIPLGLTAAESPQFTLLKHPSPVRQLLDGQVNHVLVHPDGRSEPEGFFEAALLPGSFNPLHQGHESLATAASGILNTPVVYEISVTNVDKPPLEEADILQRVRQFSEKSPVVLTRAETFHRKAQLFPGSPFVIGWDTAVRLVDSRYYGGNPETMLKALADMWVWGSRFLVAGRLADGRFHDLSDVPIPEGFRPLFSSVPESRFRMDLSSTELRVQDQKIPNL